jgi:thiamine-phosphate pyrophosphorylase
MNPVDHRLYVLLDPGAAPREALPALAKAAARGGATLFQYRDKTADGGLMVETARSIREAIAGSGIPLLINDRIDVALVAEAEGVHLGQSDIAPIDARRLLGPAAMIGRTIKNASDADRLASEPVDYATLGGVFGTVHKDNPDAPIGLDGLSDLRRRIARLSPALPVGAIAGIDARNASAVIDAGADGIAVIGAVLKADDAEGATRLLRSIVDAALAKR